MDVFPKEKSNRLNPITHPGKWDVFEHLMHQCRIIAFISFMDLATTRIFHHHLQNWTEKPLYIQNFKRVVQESKKVHYFDPSQVKWKNACKKLKSNPTLSKKTSDQRMNFKLDDNIFLTKQYFTFGFRVVPEGIGHVYQTTEAPILIYELTDKALDCEPSPSTVRRSFVEQDESLYDRYVLRPNSQYVVPPGSRYVILTVQKTLFGIEIMDWKDVSHLQDFKSHKTYKLEVYNLPPPTPAREPCMRPEERRSKKAPRRVKPPVSVAEIPLADPPMFAEMPLADPPLFHEIPLADPPMFAEMPLADPPMVADPQPIAEPSYIGVEDPLPMILESDLSQQVIDQFMKDFEKGLMSSSCRGPAHQIRLDGPNSHKPPSQSYCLPPPPDNYWGPCPVVDAESIAIVEDCQEMAEDLTTERTSGPRIQHVFKLCEPMDLTM